MAHHSCRERSGDPAAGRGASPRTGRGLVHAALICLVVVITMHPALLTDLRTGHSWHLNFAWYESFRAGLAAGEIYPRWLAGLWHGAGAADFFFYAPLPFYLAAATETLACRGCDPDRAMNLFAVAAMTLSGLAFRHFAQRFTGASAATLGALVYIVLPYHVTDWFARGSAGEFLAYAIVPVQLAALFDWLRGQRCPLRLAGSTALLILAHLPSTVVAFVFWLVLVPAILPFSDWRRLLGPAGAVLGGAGIAAAYVLPAFLLLGTVDAGTLTAEYFDPQRWLLTPANWAAQEDFYRTLWPLFAGVAAFCVAGAVGLWRGSPEVARIAVVSAAVAIFVSLPLSSMLWEIRPFSIVQFPFRYFILTDLAAALVAAAFLDRATSNQRVLLVAALVMVAALRWYPPIAPAQGLFSINTWPIEPRAGAPEWLPSEADRSGTGLAAIAAMAPVEAAGGAVRVVEDRARSLTFEAVLAEPETVRFRRTWWRFWRLVRLDTGEAVPIRRTSGFPLIEADLPAGRGAYRLELPRLAVEQAGALVSLLALLAVLGWQAAVSAARRSAGSGRTRAAACAGSPAGNP